FEISVVTQLIREAREGKGDLTVLWLDLANAYGSIPHKLVEVALLQHHVPKKVIELILDYYSNFRLRVTVGSGTSDWHRLEKGIITGCTISVILFALAMNMIVKSAELEWRGPLTKSGVRQPPIRVFMDDLTVTTTSVPGCRWILQGLEKLITWARMSFKPAKSRSLVLKKGKVTDRYRFSLAGATIPSITEQPVKSLGKVFDCSLKDSSSIQRTSKELEGWLRCVDRSGLPGRFKAWIYQRADIGYFPSTRVDKAQGKQRQHLIQQEVRAGVEEERASRMVGMGQQGAWTKWENVLQRKITWPNIWRADSLNIRFLVQAVYDVLPSPSNLHVWGKAETPSCLQCPGRGSLEHLLSSCPKALGEGRYRWRHDQVLKAVAESIAKAITTTKNYSKPQSIRFHRAGEKPTIQARARSGLLTTATDWQLEVDLGKQLKIPARITTTRLRPDMIIVSDSTKQLIILELTVPWEERMEEANERKRAKYQELVEECRSQGWRTYCEALEVGCRGFAGRSLCKVLTMLGLPGEAKRKAIRSATEAAERATRWLWIKRADPWKNAAGTQAGV
ncbi:LOW QUALITY PROTEIN: uncharacterized protein LOC121697073, partial [Alosa sapidissima]|uniref:LOW QUALITY PROTEIN: uncharacterized protein LOC121697073 n=1 Tax=Alosa sapidissima TaxID=34773 RepID=UPI001C09D93B